MKSKKNIKKNNSVQQIKKIFSHLKNGLQKFGGNNCTTQNNVMDTMKTCIPNVNVEQYKCPCNYLPLDGSKQNVYPLAHNPLNKPPYAYNKGGKKGKKNKNISGGGQEEVIEWNKAVKSFHDSGILIINKGGYYYHYEHIPRQRQIHKYVVSLNNDDILKKHFILTELGFENELVRLIEKEGWKVVEKTPEELMTEIRKIAKEVEEENRRRMGREIELERLNNLRNTHNLGFNYGGKKSKKKVKGGEYLSVDNHTNAYFRLGAKGNCCGPHWKYTNISGGKKKKKN